MNNVRPRIIWLLGAVFLILLVFAAIFALSQNNKKSPDYKTTLKDKDTGEVVYFQTNTEKEASANSYTILFGSSVIIDKVSPGQFLLIRQLLTKYNHNNFHGQYISFTFLPKSFTNSAADLMGELRLGQTNKIVKIEIKLIDKYYAQVVISDQSATNGGNFDSGMQFILSGSKDNK